MLDMAAQFFFHLGANLRTLEERGNAKAERINNPHTSSG
jgi:hypothetical protein